MWKDGPKKAKVDAAVSVVGVTSRTRRSRSRMERDGDGNRNHRRGALQVRECVQVCMVCGTLRWRGAGADGRGYTVCTCKSSQSVNRTGDVVSTYVHSLLSEAGGRGGATQESGGRRTIKTVTKTRRSVGRSIDKSNVRVYGEMTAAATTTPFPKS
ncbi:hypothetical protein GY45DRAFT_1034746 [Cubamyces sp. BRFM 1775]|nr:hypothetical protein GY45DRAFT_1034746 [Cubamyces sp. BRFM 1775]